MTLGLDQLCIMCSALCHYLDIAQTGQTIISFIYNKIPIMLLYMIHISVHVIIVGLHIYALLNYALLCAECYVNVVITISHSNCINVT